MMVAFFYQSGYYTKKARAAIFISLYYSAMFWYYFVTFVTGFVLGAVAIWKISQFFG